MLKKLVKETAIYGIGDFIFNLVKFAVFPIYAHLFTVEEFGVMSLVTVLSGLINLLLNMGMDNAVQRYYWDETIKVERRPALISTGLLILLGWSIFLTTVTLYAFYCFRDTIELRYNVLWLFLFLALISNIPGQVLQYSQNVLRLHFSPWKFTFISAWRHLFGVSFGLLLIIVFHKGLLGFFWGNFGGLVISIPLGFWLIRRDLVARFDATLARKLILFGSPFIFANIGYWIFGSLDRWMLSELSDNTQVGIYSIAFKFSTLIIFANTAFGQAWAPNAIKIYSDRSDYRKIFARVFSYLFFGLTLLGSVISLFGLEVLKLTTPESYWPAAETLSILVMGLVFSGTQQITALGIFFAKKTHLIPIAAWVTAVLNLILNLLMIPKMGAAGAALATLFSYATLSALYLYWSQKFHPIPLEFKPLFLTISVVFSTLIVSYSLQQFEWNGKIFLLKILYCCVVIGSGFFFHILKLSDLNKLRQWKSRTA